MVSPDGVAPSRMVSVSASVNLPLHHKVQEFSSGTGLPGWSQKKGRKMDVCMCVKCHYDVAVSYYGAYAVQVVELCKLPSSSNLVQFAKASPRFLRPWLHHLARLSTTSVLTSPDRLLALKIRYHISSNRSPPASISTTRMWANAQPDGRPAECR